jgi:hypothetical protein
MTKLSYFIRVIGAGTIGKKKRFASKFSVERGVYFRGGVSDCLSPGTLTFGDTAGEIDKPGCCDEDKPCKDECCPINTLPSEYERSCSGK